MKNRKNRKNKKKDKLMLPITSYWTILALISPIIGIIGELFQKNNIVTLFIFYVGAFICMICIAINRAHYIETFNPLSELIDFFKDR